MGRKFNDRNIIATLLVTPLSSNAGCSNERAKSIVARLSFIGIPLFFFSLSLSLSLFISVFISRCVSDLCQTRRASLVKPSDKITRKVFPEMIVPDHDVVAAQRERIAATQDFPLFCQA
jgi:hypothetical protein